MPAHPPEAQPDPSEKSSWLATEPQPTKRRSAPTSAECEQIGLGPWGIVARSRFLPACVRRAALAVGLVIQDVDFACYLASYCDRYGTLSRRQTTIADERHVLPRQVRKRIGKLIAAGILIRIQRGSRRITRYQFCYRPHAPMSIEGERSSEDRSCTYLESFVRTRGFIAAAVQVSTRASSHEHPDDGAAAAAADRFTNRAPDDEIDRLARGEQQKSGDPFQ